MIDRVPSRRVKRRADRAWTRKPVLAAVIAVFASMLAPAALGANDEGKAAKIGRQQQKAFFDSRDTPSSKKVLKGRAAKLAAEPPAAVTKLREALGVEGIVGIDPLTSTPRIVARLDGFLTAPGDTPAAAIGLDYVRANAAAFGLSSATIDNLRLVRD
jgi:extracellular elastinolytic metalloproteinase